MKHCEEFAALLDPYLDGELSPEETARVREHLAGCDRCRAYVQAALAIRDAFPAAEDVEVPEGFADGVMAAVRADSLRQKRRRIRWAKRLAPLAACCAVVVLAVSLLPQLQRNTAVSPAQDAAETALLDEGDASAAIENDSGAQVPAQQDLDPSAKQALPSPSDSEEGAGQTSPADVPDSSASAPEAEAVSPEAAEREAILAPYSVQSTPSLTLTAEEAGDLLSGFAPAEETEDGLLYELTAAEYSDLLGRLEQEGLTVAGAATAEEAAAAGGAMVLVVPS